MSQWAMSEFHCETCGIFEQLVERPIPDFVACPECAELAAWTISAPHPKVLSVPCFAEVRGGDTERRPGMLDTRPLAEGMSMSEWKKKQEPARQERRYQALKKKGLLAPKVQV